MSESSSRTAKRTVAVSAAFDSCCQAAETLSALGYAKESELMWRTAFERLTGKDRDQSLDAELVQAVQQLLAEPRVDTHSAPSRVTWREWRESARAVAARCSAQLRVPVMSRHGLARLALGMVLFMISALTFTTRAAKETAVSSAEYAPKHAASFALDGDLSTEWLLPDRTRGFIDIAPSRARAIRRVTVINGHNAPYMDRATREARVVVYDDDREVDSAEVRFSNLTSEHERQVAEFAGKRGTRVRVEVLEYFGLGASIAEVELE